MICQAIHFLILIKILGSEMPFGKMVFDPKVVTPEIFGAAIKD
jgi:hypothetical protein